MLPSQKLLPDTAHSYLKSSLVAKLHARASWRGSCISSRPRDAVCRLNVNGRAVCDVSSYDNEEFYESEEYWEREAPYYANPEHDVDEEPAYGNALDPSAVMVGCAPELAPGSPERHKVCRTAWSYDGFRLSPSLRPITPTSERAERHGFTGGGPSKNMQDVSKAFERASRKLEKCQGRLVQTEEYLRRKVLRCVELKHQLMRSYQEGLSLDCGSLSDSELTDNKDQMVQHVYEEILLTDQRADELLSTLLTTLGTEDTQGAENDAQSRAPAITGVADNVPDPSDRDHTTYWEAATSSDVPKVEPTSIEQALSFFSRFGSSPLMSSAHPSTPMSQEQEQIVLLYSTPWPRAYVHYRIKDGTWTAPPGVPMKQTGLGWQMIQLAAPQLEFVFTDGSQWDRPAPAPSGRLGWYHVDGPGVYQVQGGQVALVKQQGK